MTRNCDDGTKVSVNPFIADAARVAFAFTACSLTAKFIRRWSLRDAAKPGTLPFFNFPDSLRSGDSRDHRVVSLKATDFPMRMVSETPMKRPRRKLLWFAGIAVVLVAAAIASFMLRSKPQTHAAARATSIPVTVAPAAQRDVPIFLQALGTVQAAFTVSVRSQIDGKVVTVNFVEGQEVKKGDTLAEIDSRGTQGRARSGDRQEGAGCRATRIGAEGLDAFPGAWPQSLRDPAEHRPAASQGRSAKSHYRRRPGCHRKRADAALLRHHHRAARWPHRLPPG